MSGDNRVVPRDLYSCRHISDQSSIKRRDSISLSVCHFSLVCPLACWVGNTEMSFCTLDWLFIFVFTTCPTINKSTNPSLICWPPSFISWSPSFTCWSPIIYLLVCLLISHLSICPCIYKPVRQSVRLHVCSCLLPDVKSLNLLTTYC